MTEFDKALKKKESNEREEQAMSPGQQIALLVLLLAMVAVGVYGILSQG